MAKPGVHWCVVAFPGRRSFPWILAVAICCVFLGSTGVIADALDDGLAAYERGAYGVALQLLRPLAEKGEPRAQNAMGAMYVNGQGVAQDSEAALHWYRLAAAAGYSQAQNNLGVMFAEGYLVARNPVVAVRWFHLAARNGLPVAQYNLGILYEGGLGVRRNYPKAAKWYRLAADQDFKAAAHNLAVMYASGRGVRRNYALATDRYRQAATDGYAPAQNNLGLMYLNGLGLAKDLVLAYVWFSLAAEQGHVDAMRNLDMIEQHMSAEQIAEAREFARLQKSINGGGARFYQGRDAQVRLIAGAADVVAGLTAQALVIAVLLCRDAAACQIAESACQ
jgi:TPR repeat protein